MVALERSLRELDAACRTLATRLAELRVTIVEDRPEADDLALITHRRQTIDDLEGDLTEARNAIREARACAEARDDHRASRTVIAAHELLLHLEARFVSGLAGYHQLTELVSLGRQRDRLWKAWSDTVRRSVEDCQQALQAATGALLECWKDLAERANYRRADAPTERHQGRHQEHRQGRGQKSAREQESPTLTLLGKEGEGRHGTE